MATIRKRKGAKSYIADLKTTGGGYQRVTLLKSKPDSESLARKFEQCVSLRIAGDALPTDLIRWLDGLPPGHAATAHRLGILSAGQLERGRTIADLANEWRQSLLDDGKTASYAALVSNRVRTLCDGAGFVVPLDIKAEAIRRWLAAQRKGDGRDKPLSVQSSNHYLTACRTFSRWLVSCGILPTDPTAGLDKMNVAPHKTLNRRSLSESELAALLATAEAGPVILGMAGPERALLYRVAVETGLRANELRTLTRADLDLSAPAVMVRAGHTKNRKNVTLPLRPETAALLRVHCTAMLPTAQLWRVPDKTAAMLAQDLERAGIAVVDDAGDRADFHSLRGCFITRLARAGVPMATAQKLARHSDPKLTYNVYTKLGADDECAGIAALPSLEPAVQIASATGTDGQDCAENPVLSSVRNSGLYLAQADTSMTLGKGRRLAPESNRSKVKSGIVGGSAPVAQGIERRFPKP